MKVKTTNTINVAMDRNTKFPSDLPMKSRSRETGAIINAPTASFSNSCDVARVSPTTPANVIAAHKTPGPVSIALRLVGSIAIANIAITKEANITIATATSRLRDSIRNSLSVSAQTIDSVAVNRSSIDFGSHQSTATDSVDRISCIRHKFGAVRRDEDRSTIGLPFDDDIHQRLE